MNYKKSLQHQEVRLSDAILDTDWEPRREGSLLEMVIITAIIILLCTGSILTIKGCAREPMPAVVQNQTQCGSCHSKQSAMAAYFRRGNVKSPEKMAEAVMATRNPRLLAAMNVGGEKKTPHTAMRTGWKGKYSGAWQTHDRWGKITKNTTITEQALIAELALETHVAEQKDIIKGLNAYGGESDLRRGKYAFNVLQELREVP